MGRTPQELGAALTSAELTELMAFDLIEPYGTERLMDGFRLLASLNFNSNMGPDHRPLMPEDFLKVYEPPVERDEEAEAAALFRHFEKRVKN